MLLTVLAVALASSPEMLSEGSDQASRQIRGKVERSPESIEKDQTIVDGIVEASALAPELSVIRMKDGYMYVPPQLASFQALVEKIPAADLDDLRCVAAALDALSSGVTDLLDVSDTYIYVTFAVYVLYQVHRAMPEFKIDSTKFKASGPIASVYRTPEPDSWDHINRTPWMVSNGDLKLVLFEYVHTFHDVRFKRSTRISRYIDFMIEKVLPEIEGASGSRI